MDPYTQQRLIDEVLYLHSLWRQGPTTRSTASAGHSSNHLPLSNPTHFKKPGKPRRPKNAVKPISSSGIEWPVNSPPNSPPKNASGWPELKLKPNPNVKLPSSEELAKYNWNQVQQKAVKDTEAFFLSNVGSDGEGDESDDDDDDVMEDDGVCGDEYKFFLNLLNEDGELKSYLEKNCGGGGDFCCLVCGGAGKKFGRRYKDCVALIQHSVTISKTTKQRAHRAYGQAICKVLGWKIDQLPSITSNLRSTDSQVNATDQVSNALTSNMALADVGNSGTVLGMDTNACQALPDSAPQLSNPTDGEFMVCEVNAPDLVSNALTSVMAPVDGNSGPVLGIDSNACETLHDNAPEQSKPMDGEFMVCEVAQPQIADPVISSVISENQIVNEAEANTERVVTSLEPVHRDGVGSGSGNEVVKGMR